MTNDHMIKIIASPICEGMLKLNKTTNKCFIILLQIIVMPQKRCAIDKLEKPLFFAELSDKTLLVNNGQRNG